MQTQALEKLKKNFWWAKARISPSTNQDTSVCFSSTAVTDLPFYCWPFSILPDHFPNLPLTSSLPSTAQLYPSISVLPPLLLVSLQTLLPLLLLFLNSPPTALTDQNLVLKGGPTCPFCWALYRNSTQFISSLNQLPTTPKILWYRDKGCLSIGTLPFTPCLIYSIYSMSPLPHLCPQSRGCGVALGAPRAAIPAQPRLQLPALPTPRLGTPGWAPSIPIHAQCSSATTIKKSTFPFSTNINCTWW